MSIWQTANGKYRFRVVRKGRRVSGTTDTLEQARELEAKALLDLHAMRVGRAPERTLAQAIEHYIETPEYTTLKSRAELAGHIKRAVEFVGNASLGDAPDVCAKMKKALLRKKLSSATINQSIKAIKRICRLAWMEWQWLNAPVHQRIGLLKVENERHEYATYDEARSVVAEMRRTRDRIKNPRHARLARETPVIVELGFMTGLRRGEICRMPLRAIREGYLMLPAKTKNGKPRRLRLPPHLAADLANMLPFKSHPDSVSKAFKRAARRVGLGHLRFHDTRHTTASWIINSGGTLEDVRAILGHLSVVSSARYAHLAQEVADKRLAAIQDNFAPGLLSTPSEAESESSANA